MASVLWSHHTCAVSRTRLWTGGTAFVRAEIALFALAVNARFFDVGSFAV